MWYSLKPYVTEPADPVPGVLLKLRPQLSLIQAEVVYRPDPQDAVARQPAAPPIHQDAADGTEAVLHSGPGFDGLVLCEASELFLAAEVLEALVGHDEVSAEHRGADLVAVGAVADKTGEKVRAIDGLGEGKVVLALIVVQRGE